MLFYGSVSVNTGMSAIILTSVTKLASCIVQRKQEPGEAQPCPGLKRNADAAHYGVKCVRRAMSSRVPRSHQQYSPSVASPFASLHITPQHPGRSMQPHLCCLLEA